MELEAALGETPEAEAAPGTKIPPVLVGGAAEVGVEVVLDDGAAAEDEAGVDDEATAPEDEPPLDEPPLVLPPEVDPPPQPFMVSPSLSAALPA